ncbi:MAG TPA: cbb3-type cytochrome c oxidase subunit I [Candidatus Kapabacteria bacterium]|nr:cbb3-type cytochrome c oxidase subunit I [Candidatus Kapabacteria bacterium]
MDATTHVIDTHPTIEHHHAHPKLTFVQKYLFSLDHKVIGIQFMFAALLFLLIGGILALILRWQLAYPGEALPWYLLGGVLPETMLASNGALLPEFYNTAFTMHATFMIFFAAMPLLIGVFGNFLIPLQIGARDMAFPVMNMLSFWIALPAGMLMVASFFVEGGAAASGWTGYPTLSAHEGFTGVGLGMNLWLVSLLVLGVSSVLGAINYITTIINMRAPGMTMFRMPLTVWSLFVTAILLLLALPVLTAALVMLLMDRSIGTNFFLPTGLLMAGTPLDNVGGGQPLLYQHLFWFFGHPEVYILVLPGMGIASELLSTFSRKPIFGYRAMVFSMIGIAFLSWIVWGHHMFQSGMNPVLGTTFMISTMVIAVPSAIKVFNWLGTIWGGNIRFTVPMLYALAFIAMFTIGGLSGIFMASTPVDAFIHDTYFIVAHFHYVIFGGSLFAIFGGITFWYPKMFGRMMNPTLGKIHFWLSFIAFNCTFFPMHILGIGGHMRRIYDPTVYTHLQHMQPINEFITISAIVLGFSQIIFLFNLLYSLVRGERASANPWQANTLEWTIPSPAGHGNFDDIPTVYHGPHEYSSPLVTEDYLPQTRRVGEDAVSLAVGDARAVPVANGNGAHH